jgi:hypothetical protein
MLYERKKSTPTAGCRSFAAVHGFLQLGNPSALDPSPPLRPMPTTTPARSRRRDRKRRQISLNTDKKNPLRAAGRGELFFLARSRCLAGCREFCARLFRHLDRRWTTSGGVACDPARWRNSDRTCGTTDVVPRRAGAVLATRLSACARRGRCWRLAWSSTPRGWPRTSADPGTCRSAGRPGTCRSSPYRPTGST